MRFFRVKPAVYLTVFPDVVAVQVQRWPYILPHTRVVEIYLLCIEQRSPASQDFCQSLGSSRDHKT
jgi:hypothetical protein